MEQSMRSRIKDGSRGKGGYTETDMLSDPQFRTIGVQASPLGRLGTPTDIANVVSFLVSGEAGWITGDTIQAGGGVAI
jgi:3-oxoacyl-[acyl-carrier protein] reductase